MTITLNIEYLNNKKYTLFKQSFYRQIARTVKKEHFDITMGTMSRSKMIFIFFTSAILLWDQKKI